LLQRKKETLAKPKRSEKRCSPGERAKNDAISRSAVTGSGKKNCPNKRKWTLARQEGCKKETNQVTGGHHVRPPRKTVHQIRIELFRGTASKKEGRRSEKKSTEQRQAVRLEKNRFKPGTLKGEVRLKGKNRKGGRHNSEGKRAAND